MPTGIAAQIIAAEYAAARPFVIAYKYSRQHVLAEPLGKLLADTVARHPFAFRADIVAPVPIHRARRTDRGFNQSEPLAITVAHRLNRPMVPNAVTRTRATLPQARLRTSRERADNVTNAFAVADTTLVRGKHILLVDDVITTGATVGACAEVLIGAGAASVATAALAHPFHDGSAPLDTGDYDI